MTIEPHEDATSMTKLPGGQIYVTNCLQGDGGRSFPGGTYGKAKAEAYYRECRTHHANVCLMPAGGWPKDSE